MCGLKKLFTNKDVISLVIDQYVSSHVLCTSVSLESGDQAAAVLLQLQDSHLAGLVPYEGVSSLYIKPGIRLRSRKKKLRPAEELMTHSFRSLSVPGPKHRPNEPGPKVISEQTLSCTVNQTWMDD